MATKPDNTPKTNSDEALIENNHEAENFQIRQKDSTSRVNTSERSEPAFQEEPSDMSFLALQREAGTSEDIISVKDFGAKGDGRTNDTAAFQNAINFFAQGGTGNAVKHIFIPAGHYKVTGNILIPATANSLLFYGTGPRVSIIEYTVSDAHEALFIS